MSRSSTAPLSPGAKKAITAALLAAFVGFSGPWGWLAAISPGRTGSGAAIVIAASILFQSLTALGVFGVRLPRPHPAVLVAAELITLSAWVFFQGGSLAGSVGATSILRALILVFLVEAAAAAGAPGGLALGFAVIEVRGLVHGLGQLSLEVLIDATGPLIAMGLVAAALHRFGLERASLERIGLTPRSALDLALLPLLAGAAAIWVPHACGFHGIVALVLRSHAQAWVPMIAAFFVALMIEQLAGAAGEARRRDEAAKGAVAEAGTARAEPPAGPPPGFGRETARP